MIYGGTEVPALSKQRLSVSRKEDLHETEVPPIPSKDFPQAGRKTYGGTQVPPFQHKKNFPQAMKSPPFKTSS